MHPVPMEPSFMFTSDPIFIRHLTIDDAPFIFSLMNTPGWLKYIGDRKIYSIEDAERYIENGPLKDYKNYGFGLNLITLLSTKEPVGVGGFLKRDYLDYPDIGYALLPKYQGQGIIHHACNELIKWGREVLGFTILQAITHPDNVKSIGLLQRMEFVFERKLELEGELINLYQKKL